MSGSSSYKEPPKWDGDIASFQKFKSELCTFLVMRNGAIHVLPLNDEVGWPVPIGTQAEREYEKKAAEATCLAVLRASVSDPKLEGIVAAYNSQYPNENDHVGNNPARLWTAFTEAARGEIRLQGPMLMAKIEDWKWPKNGSMVDQVKQAVLDFKSFIRQAETLHNPQYPFTGGLAVIQLCKKLPVTMSHLKPFYTEFQSLHEFEALATTHALDIDRTAVPNSTSADHAAFITTLKALGVRVDGNVVKQLKALGSDGTKATNQSSRARRMDFDAGPTKPGLVYCKVHGWGNHPDSKCFKQGAPKPAAVPSAIPNAPANSAPTAKQSPAPDTVPPLYYVSDGRLLPWQPKVLKTTLSLVLDDMTKNGTDLNTDTAFYIDSCADVSIVNSLSLLDTVIKLDPADAPFICGVSGSPTRATHHGYRRIPIGKNYVNIQFYYTPGGVYNLLSTDDLATAGVATSISSDPPLNPLTLTLKDCSPITCVKIGHIWRIPDFVCPIFRACAGLDVATPTDVSLQGVRNEKPSAVPIPSVVTNDADTISKATPSTTRTEVPLLSSVPSIDDESPSIDYQFFRTQLGNHSHRRTIEAASKLGIQLTNIGGAPRVNLDRLARVANQSAKPLTSINDTPIGPVPLQTIIGDTIGSKFPTSHQGNSVCQTWVLKDAPESYYVTVGSDGSAATSVAGFKLFLREAGIVLPAESLNSGTQFLSDNGPEYMADFDSLLERAGIHHPTSTAYRKSSSVGIVEGANQKAQARMRASLELAEANLYTFGFVPWDFWDDAIRLGALQARIEHQVRNGGVSYEQVNRLLPAHFGAVGVITIQKTAPARVANQKQLAKRGVQALFLGTVDGKYKMLLEGGEIVYSMDVSFDSVQTPTPVPLSTSSITNVSGVAHPQQISSTTTVSPSFHDCHGKRITVGDTARLFWPAERAVYSGSVVAIRHDQKEFDIHYDIDDTTVTHRYSDVRPMKLLRIGAALAARNRERLKPHESALPYLDAAGNILPCYTLGETAFPTPAPPADLPRTTYIPRNVSEALHSPLALHWIDAMLHETLGHLKPQPTEFKEARPPTFRFTDQSITSQRKLKLNWVFTIKWNGDQLLKFKARLVIAGWGLTQGVDYYESYLGTPLGGDVLLLEQVRALYKFQVFEIDQKQAYCNARLPPLPNGQSLVVQPIPGMPVRDQNGLLLSLIVDQALYGHPSSGFALQTDTFALFLNTHEKCKSNPCPITFVQCPTQPTIFKAVFNEDNAHYGKHFVLWLNSDNLRVYIDPSLVDQYHTFRNWFQSVVEITGGDKPLDQIPPQSCLGVQFTYHANGLTCSMETFIRDLLANTGMMDCNPVSTPSNDIFDKSICPQSEGERHDVLQFVNTNFNFAVRQRYGHLLTDYQQATNFYQAIVSSVGWIAKNVGPSIALAHSMLGRTMHMPAIRSFKALKRMLRYLSGNMQMSIHICPVQQLRWGHDLPNCFLQCDASFADDCSDYHSQGGYICGLERMPAYWSSQKSQRVCTSTTHAETYFASVGAKHAVYVRNLLSFFNLIDLSIPFYVELDSKSTVTISGAPIAKFTPKQKHFHVDEHFVAEQVREGVISLHHIPGDPDFSISSSGLAADCLTKPLSAPVFSHYLPYLHGTTGGVVSP